MQENQDALNNNEEYYDDEEEPEEGDDFDEGVQASIQW